VARLVRGSVCWAELGPVRGKEQAGRRPVVIMSQDVFNERSGTVIAMAMTSQPQKAGYPLTLKLPAPLLGRNAWVKISQVRTLSIDRIGRKIGQLESDQLDRIVDGLREIIDR
jgi:mRNA interferase MazF